MVRSTSNFHSNYISVDLDNSDFSLFVGLYLSHFDQSTLTIYELLLFKNCTFESILGKLLANFELVFRKYFIHLNDNYIEGMGKNHALRFYTIITPMCLIKYKLFDNFYQPYLQYFMGSYFLLSIWCIKLIKLWKVIFLYEGLLYIENSYLEFIFEFGRYGKFNLFASSNRY